MIYNLIHLLHYILKGGLISEGILTLVPLPAKDALSRKFKFSALFSKQLIQIFSSEIKPPLGSMYYNIIYLLMYICK